MSSNEYKECKICGRTNGNFKIHRHHINYNHGDNRPENLIYLCASCHKRVHQYVRRHNKELITLVKQFGFFECNDMHHVPEAQALFKKLVVKCKVGVLDYLAERFYRVNKEE